MYEVFKTVQSEHHGYKRVVTQGNNSSLLSNKKQTNTSITDTLKTNGLQLLDYPKK